LASGGLEKAPARRNGSNYLREKRRQSERKIRTAYFTVKVTGTSEEGLESLSEEPEEEALHPVDKKGYTKN